MTSPPRRHVVCLGDSLTRGQISTDYVKMLAARTSADEFEFTNAGVNAELAENTLRRLDSVVALRPDLVTVLIGSNDVDASMSEKNTSRVVRMNKLSRRPTIETFGEDVTAIIERLANETSARIGLLSLPVLGEELDSESLRRSRQYSDVLKQIAQAQGVAYLPLNERQIEYLKAGGFTPGTRYRDGVGLLAGGAIQHFILRRSLDDIGRRRGLALTTDLKHQNTRGATVIADVIEEFLSS
jgi:lysophospholipase L1-like esterase